MPVTAKAVEQLYGWDFAGLGIFTTVYELQERFFRLVVLFGDAVLRPRYADGIDEINEALSTNGHRFTAPI